MPRGNELHNSLVRILAYGPEKSYKTWWSMRAAEFGYRVIHLNGDKGSKIIQSAPLKNKERIYSVDCFDTFNTPVCAEVLVALFTGHTIIWNDTRNTYRVMRRIDRREVSEEDTYYVLRLEDLGSSDFLVIDSFTAFVTSMSIRYAMEKDISMEDIDRFDWDFYRKSDIFLSWFSSRLRALACNVIMIGHEDTYEKIKVYPGQKKSDAQKEAIVDKVRAQIFSSSRPQAGKLGKDFDDVLRFFFQGTGLRIQTESADDRMCGCRSVPPGNYKWEELPISKFAAPRSEYVEGPGFWYFPNGSIKESEEFSFDGEAVKGKPLAKLKLEGSSSSK